MKNDRRTELANSSEWYDAILIDRPPTRLSGIAFVMLCVLMALATAAYGSVDTWSLAILAGGASVIATLWLTDSTLAREFRFNANPLQLPLLALILIGLIQLLPLRDPGIAGDLLGVSPARSLSLDPNTTLLAIVNYSVFFIVFAAALTFIDSQKRLRRMVYFIIIFGAIVSFYGIIQNLTGTDSIYGLRVAPYGKPFAAFINRHHFAAFMEMTLGLTLSLLYGNATKRDKKLLLIMAVLLMGIGLLLTGSRGGILSFLAVLGFVTLGSFRKDSRRNSSDEPGSSNTGNKLLLIGGSLILVLVLIGTVLFIGGDSSLTRGFGLGETIGMDNQSDVSTGRLHYWGTGLKIILDHPVIGAGLDSFGTAFTRYDTDNGIWRVEQAHNEYLQIIADAGILGLVCVAAFIYLLFKQGFGVINKTSDRFRRGVALGALAGCFGILVHSFFDFPLRTPSNALFFLVLAALATNKLHHPKLHRNTQAETRP